MRVERSPGWAEGHAADFRPGHWSPGFVWVWLYGAQKPVYLDTAAASLSAGRVMLTDTLEGPEEAESAYRRAIELDPKEAGHWNNLGNLLTRYLERYQEAEAAYRRAIELDPKQACRTWTNLGLLLAQYLGRYQEAEAAFRPRHRARSEGISLDFEQPGQTAD